jgi:hypothetical protein
MPQYKPGELAKSDLLSQFFLQDAPAFLGFGELPGKIFDLLVQPNGFLGLGGREELSIRQLFLFVQAGDRLLEVAHLLAKFPFATQRRLGRGLGFQDLRGRLRHACGCLAFAFLDLLVDGVEIGLIIAMIVDDPAIANLDD